MPTIFEIFGMRFFFYANDHEPIHVHVVKGEAHAKISIEPELKLVESKGMKTQDEKRALELVAMYRNEIIEKWNEFFGE